MASVPPISSFLPCIRTSPRSSRGLTRPRRFSRVLEHARVLFVDQVAADTRRLRAASGRRGGVSPHAPAAIRKASSAASPTTTGTPAPATARASTRAHDHVASQAPSRSFDLVRRDGVPMTEEHTEGICAVGSGRVPQHADRGDQACRCRLSGSTAAKNRSRRRCCGRGRRSNAIWGAQPPLQKPENGRKRRLASASPNP